MLQTRTTRFLLPLAFVLTLAACKPATQDTAADKTALQAVANGWEPAYNNKDAAAVAALYADDAQLLPPGMAAVSGMSAIKDYWANDIATNWSKLTLKEESSDVGGDWAWRTGTWSAETSPPLAGKWAEVWHRTPAGWKIHRDIWNMDAAPPPPEAPAAPAETPAK